MESIQRGDGNVSLAELIKTEKTHPDSARTEKFNKYSLD
jgi:hypothetical protein